MTALAAQILAGVEAMRERVDNVPDWYCTNSVRGDGWGSRGDCPLCGAYSFDGTESVTEDAAWEHLENAHDRANVLRLTTALRKVVELHSPRRQDPEWKALGQLPACAECGSDIAPRRWPCPTLAALASVWDEPGDNT